MLQACEHLELEPPARLSGPTAAVVQQQLEELAGKSFSGAQAPPMRKRVKSKDVHFQDFPQAQPKLSTCRQHPMQAHGLDEDALARLVHIQRERAEKPSSSHAASGHADEEEEDDEEDL